MIWWIKIRIINLGNLHMAEVLRVTARFNPIIDPPPITYYTSSLLYVDAIHKNITWRRRCGDCVDILPHLNGISVYKCTPLDANCIIQAIVSQKNSSKTVLDTKFEDKETHCFGPIKARINQKLNDDEGVFYGQIKGNGGKKFQCQLSFQNGQLLITPAQFYGLQNQVFLNCHDISACETRSPFNSFEVVFLTVFVRIICLKIFNQIVSKGSYAENNDKLSIKILGNTEKNKSQKDQFARFLFNIKTFKSEKYRRLTTSLDSQKTRKIISYSLLQNSTSDHKNDITKDSFALEKSIISTQRLRTCQSQFFSDNENTKRQRFPSLIDGFGESHKDYFNEFEELIFNQEEEPVEMLVLKESFEQLENNLSVEKEIEKLKYVQSRKMERNPQYNGKVETLKMQLIRINEQNRELQKVNEVLKDNVTRLEKKEIQPSLHLNRCQRYLDSLKAEYQMLRKGPQKLCKAKSQKNLPEPLHL